MISSRPSRKKKKTKNAASTRHVISPIWIMFGSIPNGLPACCMKKASCRCRFRSCLTKRSWAPAAAGRTARGSPMARMKRRRAFMSGALLGDVLDRAREALGIGHDEVPAGALEQPFVLVPIEEPADRVGVRTDHRREVACRQLHRDLHAVGTRSPVLLDEI